MDLLQSWLVVGIPGLVVVGSLFTGRSPMRTSLGYLSMAGLLIFFLLAARDPSSAAVIGVAGTLLLAVGRGGAIEQEPDQHERRRELQRIDNGA